MAEENKNPIVLSVKNLNVYFKTHGKDSHVIRGVDLDIKRGEVFAIVGESGSGKSVFTKTFTGMLESNGKIKTGSILLSDVPLNDPKVIRMRFSDINRFKRKMAKYEKEEYHNFINLKIAELEEKYNKECEKLQQESDLWTDKGYQKSLKETADAKKAKQETYLAAFYNDEITKAYNDISNNAIKKQAITDKFLKKVNRILNDAKFENREDHTSVFSSLLSEALEKGTHFNQLKKEYEEIDLSKFEDFSKEQKSALKKKESIGYRYSKAFERIFFKTLLEYRHNQHIEYPLNPVAYQDLLDAIEEPIAPIIEQYNISSAENARNADEQILSLLNEYRKEKLSYEQIKSLAKKAIEIKGAALKQFATTYNETILEEIDFKDHDFLKDEFNQKLGFSKKVQLLRQHMSLYSNFNQPEYLALVEKLKHEEQSIFGETYESLIEDLLGKINSVSSEHSSNIRLFYSGILTIAEEYIYSGVSIRKELYGLNVKERRKEQIEAVKKLHDDYEKEIANIATLTHSDETKVQVYEKQIAEKQDKLKAEIAKLREQEKTQCEILEQANKSLVEEYKLDPKFLTFPTKLVTRFAKAKKQIEEYQQIVEDLEDKIIEKREEALKTFDAGDLDKTVGICAEIQFGAKYYVKRYAHAEQEKDVKLAQIAEKISKLPSDSRHDELQHLLEVERDAVNSTYDATYKQISTDFRKALKIFTPEDNTEVVKTNEKIHNLQNEVSPIRILYRNIRNALRIKKPMILRLRNDGIIRGNTINLAKLKTNREWSIVRGSHVATIFQDPMTSLNPLLTIGSQISDVLRLHHNLTRKEAKQEAINLLGRVHIPNPEVRYKEYPYQYSGGMRQRVVIAIALACRPDILICDEPTTALDVTVQAQILELIKDLQKEYEFTTIFITHDLGVVAGVADRIGVMYGGQFVEIGTDEDVFYNSAHPYTWALLSSLPQLAVENEPLVYIRGNPPVFTKEIDGDAFSPRSDYAMRIDTMIEPPMFKISETHYAKTWLLDPRAPKVKKPTIIRNLAERMKKTAESFLATEKGE